MYTEPLITRCSDYGKATAGISAGDGGYYRDFQEIRREMRFKEKLISFTIN
jgi:hypothetical protein